MLVNINSVEKVKVFVQITSRFDFEADLVSGKYVVDAKSIMGIFSLDLASPIKMTIHSDAPEEILEALKDYLVK